MLQFDCPAPRAETKTPAFAAPPGACDCHVHVFGPYDAFPLSPARGYTPPPAPLPALRRVQEVLRLQRCVLVQPSVYGTDHTCMMDALRRLGPECGRGVAVVDDGFTLPQLQVMHALGVRGVRFNAVSGGGPVTDQLTRIAHLIAPLGWHLQVFMPPQDLVARAALLRNLPVPVIIDHLGEIDPRRGLEDDAFLALRRLLESGRIWVKLTGYRLSQAAAPFDDLTPFVRALAEMRPDRLVWRSNWPHPIRYAPMPDDGDLLDALATWLGDRDTIARVLVDNPAQLYGFPAPGTAGC